MKTIKHLMVIDPAVQKPAIESYNRIASISPFPVTYHLPALFGTNSLKIFSSNIRGLIVFGSAASINDDNNWQKDIAQIMLKASSNSIPVLGLCYGHQLIGHVYGGKVGPLWSGEKKQGERVVNLENNSIWGQAQSGPMLYSHQDGITEMPPGFSIVGESDLVKTEVIASDNEPIWGFQTHIEATQAFVDDHKIPVENPKDSFRFGNQILDQFIMSLI